MRNAETYMRQKDMADMHTIEDVEFYLNGLYYANPMVKNGIDKLVEIARQWRDDAKFSRKAFKAYRETPRKRGRPRKEATKQTR